MLKFSHVYYKMNKFTVVIVLLALASSIDGASVIGKDIFTGWEGRIVGGSTATAGQFPYQVSLRTATNAHFCGGWIHNTRWVVSTAHCTVGRTTANTYVAVGAHSITSGTSHATTSIANHGDYVAATLENDISAVKTTGTIVMVPGSVASIPLGTTTIGGSVAAVITGWGYTAYPGGPAAPYLQYLNTTTMTNVNCKAAHTPTNRLLVYDNTICAFNSAIDGLCLGDSGGALVAGGSAIGAVSWGVPCAVGYPDVYARVSSHITWLTTTMV